MHLHLDAGLEPIAGYTLVRLLGRGGFGEVWEALAPGGVRVALKFIRLGTDQAGPEQRALEVIRDIRHPHLLDVQFAARVADCLAIAMPLCDQSLKDRLDECQDQGLPGVPRDELFGYMNELAQAVDFLNEPRHPAGEGGPVGVQHRDIKPHNVFLVGGSARLADFGLAKVLEASRASHTGAMSPHYVAPEVIEGQVSRWSDQYALAVTYTQLRTGRLPFAGDSVHQVLYAHVHEPPNLSGLPEPERPLVARALAKQPEQRWPSCRAFVLHLEAAALVEDSRLPSTEDETKLDQSRARAPLPPTQGDDASPSGLESAPMPLPQGRPPRQRWLRRIGLASLAGLSVMIVVSRLDLTTRDAAGARPEAKTSSVAVVATRTAAVESPLSGPVDDSIRPEPVSSASEPPKLASAPEPSPLVEAQPAAVESPPTGPGDGSARPTPAAPAPEPEQPDPGPEPSTPVESQPALSLSLALNLANPGPVVPGPAPPASANNGHPWALLIGVEKYLRVNPLVCSLNDVRQLSNTLRQRGGFERDHVLELIDDAPDPRLRPLKARLMAELPRFLARPGPGDQVFVYFTGHGFRAGDGVLYLAPLDCDPADPAGTGLPVAWLRDQLAGCKARFKLLVLDACHAGSEKGDEQGIGVAASDLGERFRDVEGVVTLASSTAGEKSQVWEERQQSLFSYWLNQGLKGHADDDGDGQIDLDELYKYVYRNVTRTAKARFPRMQTPVRIVRSGTPGVPVLLRLRPQGLRLVLADMAEQVAESIEQRKLSRVGVLEFTNETRLGELLGADFGLLGHWCADELERRLVTLGEGRFSVTDRKRLQAALDEQKFAVDDLGSAPALRRLADRVGGMPALALGALRGRTGRVVSLQCKLVQTDDEDLAGTAGGSAVLSESEWAMLGRSVVVRPDDRMPDLPDPDRLTRPLADQVINRFDQHAKAPHPLLDPSFPFQVRVKIEGKPRPGIVRGNDWFVPVREGEVYELEVENRSDRIVCMRLLVDGLNTLPERDDSKGVLSSVWGKRVNLGEARHYVLDPAFSRVFAVRGFAQETGSRASYREFRVASPERSLAARRRFTDQIGLITAAFYHPAAGSRQLLGTEAGEERRASIGEHAGVQVGNLIAVIYLRYGDADELNAAGR